MKKYLVTGGAGFIGANFVKYLLDTHGDNVAIHVLDSLTYAGNLLSLEKELALPNVSFTRGDILDSVTVSRIMAEFDPDYIVNFAAESHVDRSIERPRLFLETNILGTQNMLEQARRAWLVDGTKDTYRPGKRFLQISTDEVYGSLARDFDSAHKLEISPEVARVASGRTDLHTFGSGMFTEQTPLAPRSPYSAAKTGADHITLAYHETYGLPVNITRCSNNYGPYQFPEKLIPLIINNILTGKRLPVYGRGENVRDWLYVTDHSKAIDMVLRRGRVGEIYNIGGFNEATNIDIVRTVIDTVACLMRENPEYLPLLKRPIEEVNDSLIDYVTDRPGHDMRYAIDPTKIATELGWYPETPFSRGIIETVRWYLDNQPWVESVTSGEYQNYYRQMYSDR